MYAKSSKWNLEGEIEYLYTFKLPPHEILINKKEKRVTLQWKNWKTTTLIKWPKLSASAMWQIKIMCHLIGYYEHNTASFLWYRCQRCISWMQLWESIRKTQAEGCIVIIQEIPLFAGNMNPSIWGWWIIMLAIYSQTVQEKKFFVIVFQIVL